jgi:hypothetical protein
MPNLKTITENNEVARCSTTVVRTVTYQIQNLSGTNGRVGQAFDLAGVTSAEGAPSLRLRSGQALRTVCEGRVSEMLALLVVKLQACESNEDRSAMALYRLSALFVLSLVLCTGSSFAERQSPELLRWNSAALHGICDSKLSAPMAARALAIVHTCMYDAWSAYDDRATGTPYYLVVVTDQFIANDDGFGNGTRNIGYQVQNFSGSNVNNSIPIGETHGSDTGWSCTNHAAITTHQTACGAGKSTDSFGTFTDGWGLSGLTLTPVGCGFSSDSTTWNWCDGATFTHELTVINGYIHTNAVSEFGVVNPPNTIAEGTKEPH